MVGPVTTPVTAVAAGLTLVGRVLPWVRILVVRFGERFARHLNVRRVLLRVGHLGMSQRSIRETHGCTIPPYPIRVNVSEGWSGTAPPLWLVVISAERGERSARGNAEVGPDG
jgi:hypothetical protein